MKSANFPEKYSKNFFNIFRELNYHYGCTYFSYYIEIVALKKKFTFSTDPEWAKLFISENWMKDCPLMSIGWNINKIILDWETAPINNARQKNVSGIRSDFGYEKGLSFSNKAFGVMESLGLATDRSNFDFKDSILNDLSGFVKIINEFSSLSFNLLAQLKKDERYITSKNIMPLALLGNEITQKRS